MLRTTTLLMTVIFLNCSAEWSIAQDGKTQFATAKSEPATLQPGDILGMLVLPQDDDSTPVTHVPTRAGLRPFVGDPIQVLDDGTITPLFLEPQSVAGLTIDQARQLIVEAYATAGINTKFALQLAELPGTQIVDNLADYTAQPGDVIVIDCPDLMDSLPATFGLFRDDTFPCQGYPFLVDDKGKLSFAVIGDLGVEGKKLSEIRQQILERLIDRAIIVDLASLKFHVSLAWQRQLNSPVTQPLQPGDIVSIEIGGIFNDLERAITVSRGRDEDCGPAMGLPFQIDVEGNIEVPVLGKTRAADLMVSELRNKIRNEFIAQEILVEASVHISLMEKYQFDEPPPKFQIAPGDVLNIFVQGIVEPGLNEPVQIYEGLAPILILEPPRTIRVHVPQDERIPPSIGVPCLVREDGTILLPLLDPIPVQGLTVEELSKLLVRKYEKDRRPEPTFVQFYSRSPPK